MNSFQSKHTFCGSFVQIYVTKHKCRSFLRFFQTQGSVSNLLKTMLETKNPVTSGFQTALPQIELTKHNKWGYHQSHISKKQKFTHQHVFGTLFHLLHLHQIKITLKYATKWAFLVLHNIVTSTRARIYTIFCKLLNQNIIKHEICLWVNKFVAVVQILKRDKRKFMLTGRGFFFHFFWINVIFVILFVTCLPNFIIFYFIGFSSVSEKSESVYY